MRCTGLRSFIDKARSFTSELKRRRVLRAAAVYMVVGLGVLSAAEVILDPLGLDALRPSIVILVLLCFPLAIVLAWAYEVTPEGIKRTGPLQPVEGVTSVGEGATHGNAAVRARHPTAHEAAAPGPGRGELYPREAVAVLPFANLSDQAENQYFADGITEDITTHLSRIRSLRVVARTSAMRFRPGEHSAAEIAQQLRVGSILEGSVRRAGSRVRITAQLIDAGSEVHLWADTYDRELDDIFAIQTEVSQQIAEVLKAELSPRERAQIERPPTQNLEAYDLYLKGRFHWGQRTEESLGESIILYGRAVESDPSFALAHAGLAEALATIALYNARPPTEVMPAAKEAARRALSLDRDLGAAFAALGCVRGVYDWEWEAAEQDFQTAVSRSPGYATGHHWYALQNLAPRGKLEEAHAALRVASDLDPLSSVVQASRGFLEFLARDYPRAVVTLEAVLEKDPDFAMAHYFLGETLARMGKHSEAMEALRTAGRLRGHTPEAVFALALAHARAGEGEEARSSLNHLLDRADGEFVSPTRIALIQAALGDVDGAFTSLDAAVSLRTTDLMWVKMHPAFDPLREDARFLSILKTVRLG
jgi:serine/threonine-protein kinase